MFSTYASIWVDSFVENQSNLNEITSDNQPKTYGQRGKHFQGISLQ